MGESVSNQVNTDRYFSISTISLEKMKQAGLNMTVAELREKARKSANYQIIFTGESRAFGHRKKTKIYKYEDFKEIQDDCSRS